jgi:hypothetical protein
VQFHARKGASAASDFWDSSSTSAIGTLGFTAMSATSNVTRAGRQPILLGGYILPALEFVNPPRQSLIGGN